MYIFIASFKRTLATAPTLMSNTIFRRQDNDVTLGIFYGRSTHNDRQPMFKQPTICAVFNILNSPNYLFPDRWKDQHIVKTGHFAGSRSALLSLPC